MYMPTLMPNFSLNISQLSTITRWSKKCFLWCLVIIHKHTICGNVVEKSYCMLFSYVAEKNYVRKKFKTVSRECKFTFAISFFRKNNGWTMARILFVTFEDICYSTVKIENNLIALLEIKFYWRNNDDISNSHQQNVEDILSKHQHYPRIKSNLIPWRKNELCW